jgi:hypothetical protein
MTREEEDGILAQAKEIEQRRAAEYRGQSEANRKRAESGKPPFTEAELLYAATARCKCGAGFAYPDMPFAQGFWACSALLISGDRTADEAAKHDPAMPFMFWEVKSESQPSAYGATTRPATTTSPEGSPR